MSVVLQILIYKADILFSWTLITTINTQKPSAPYTISRWWTRRTSTGSVWIEMAKWHKVRLSRGAWWVLSELPLSLEYSGSLNNASLESRFTMRQVLNDIAYNAGTVIKGIGQEHLWRCWWVRTKYRYWRSVCVILQSLESIILCYSPQFASTWLCATHLNSPSYHHQSQQNTIKPLSSLHQLRSISRDLNITL